MHHVSFVKLQSLRFLTSNTAGLSWSMPSRFRRAALDWVLREKAGRIGSPCRMIFSLATPCFRAAVSTVSVGTKRRVTSGWNHVGWHVVRSVTTVAKGTCRHGGKGQIIKEFH